MLEPVVDFEVEPELTTPVTTWSPGCSPLTICVLTPSVIPVCTCTATGDPLRSTLTLPFVMAALGTTTALSAESVMMVTVAVISGSNCTVVGSTEIRTVYVTTLELVLPAGSIVATVPVKVWFG